MSAPSMLTLQFLTETLQVRTGVNTSAGTNQDKKSPGTHLGLTLWLSSALRAPIWSFPASKLSFEGPRILALACATPEKHWCPVSTFACFRGRAFLGIQSSSPCVAKLNKSLWSETRMLSASRLNHLHDVNA